METLNKSFIRIYHSRNYSLNVKFRATRLKFSGTTKHTFSSSSINFIDSSSKSSVVICNAINNPAIQYATALGELAMSKNILEEVNNDVGIFGSVIENHPQVYTFLINPVVPADKKKDILKQIAAEKNFNRYTLNLLCLLVDKRRMPILKNILNEFKQVYDKLTDTEQVIITSAVPLQDHHIEEIAQKIQTGRPGKKLKVTNVVDKSVIAGFVVKFGWDMVDLSVKGHFDKLVVQLKKPAE